MSDPLGDRDRLPFVLAQAAEAATRYLAAIDGERVHGGRVEEAAAAFSGSLPETGDGSAEAIALHRLNSIDAAVKGALEHGLP